VFENIKLSDKRTKNILPFFFILAMNPFLTPASNQENWSFTVEKHRQCPIPPQTSFPGSPDKLFPLLRENHTARIEGQAANKLLAQLVNFGYFCAKFFKWQQQIEHSP